MPYLFVQLGRDGMPFLFSLILLMLTSANPAFARDLPTFNREDAPHVYHHQRADIQKFRVLVYPHQGMYPIPQGKESDPKSVTISAAKGCTSYAAMLDENKNWIKFGPALGTITSVKPTGDAFSLAAFILPASIYYECAGPFVVQRPKPLSSISYSGDFVTTNEKGQVLVINVIDPELYLKGVIPSEVEAAWPKEVLKAQAIAARSYAWWTVFDSRQPMTTADSNYDMDDTVFYQAYLGNLTRATATDAAADATANTVMEYNHEVIKAYFSADSGGFTEDASAVFPGNFPYCQAKKEQYDIAKTKTAWDKVLTFDQLTIRLVGQKLLPENVKVMKVWMIDVDFTRSGRASAVNVLGSDDKTYVVSGSDFRYATKVRSNLFTVIQSKVDITFDGKGYGHGVGMAQIGALEYSKQFNWTFDKILNFYYTDVTFVHE